MPPRTRERLPQPAPGAPRRAADPRARPAGIARIAQLQRSIGNQATVRLLQRKGKGSAAKPKRPPATELGVRDFPAEGIDPDLVADLTLRVALDVGERVNNRGRRVPAPLVLRERWPLVVELLLNPSRLRKPPGDKYEALANLFDPALAGQLEPLTEEQRLAVASQVQRGVLELRQETPFDELRAEYAQVHSNLKGNLSGGFLGWVAMRQGLLRCFGTLDQLNAYFGALVPADFPSNKVRGYHTLVHADLKARLDRAKDLIVKRGWLTLVENAIAADGLWATQVRENTARPTDVGTHAFGWAVDIAADKNPDIRPFPEELADVIGADAGNGPAVKALRDPAITTADAIRHARDLRQMSDRIVAAFANKDSIARAIADFLSREGAGSLTAADRTALTGLLDAVAQAKDKKDAASAIDAVVAWVLARQDKARAEAAAAAAPDPGDRSVKVQITSREDSRWVVEMAAALGGLSASDAELDKRWKLIEQQIDAPTRTVPADAKKLGLSPLYSKASVEALAGLSAEGRYYTKQNLRRTLEQRMHRKAAAATTARAVDIYRLFLEAEQARPGGPKAHATRGSVAAHGFLSLPPELVGALVSDEGAGLRWLGVMEGSKDSMHFELRPGNLPQLPGGPYPAVLHGPGDGPRPAPEPGPDTEPMA